MNDRSTREPTGASTSLQYDLNARDERDSGKVLLLGGVAAGLVGGLFVLLSEREKQEPVSRLEQARIAIEEAATKTRSEGKKATRGAKKKRTGMNKKTRKNAAETQANIGALLVAARDEARGTLEDVQKHAPDMSDLAHQLRSRRDDAATDAKERGRAFRKQAGKDADKARNDVNSLMDALKSKAADAEKVAESYMESNLLPKLKDFEKEASSRMDSAREKARTQSQELRTRAEKDVIPQARERTEKLRKHAEEDLLPQAKARAEQLRKHAQADLVPQAKESATKLKSVVGDQANVAAENWDKNAQEAARKLSEARDVARGQAQDAGESVKRGGRETRSLLIWLGLAGTIVYCVFLNEGQQAKVKELGMELFGEAKDMYGDIKGDGHSLSA